MIVHKTAGSLLLCYVNHLDQDYFTCPTDRNHTLKAEINAEAWATLNSNTSREFDKLKHGRIAVKVINHQGDEVMKGETVIRWMGHQGFAYVWNYHKNSSSYYTRVFYNPDRGVVDVASAVKYSAQSGRPWN